MSAQTCYLPTKFVVFSGSDGYYYSMNGTTGKMVYNGSDAAAVINSTLTGASGLTSGRTWQERVLLKGRFTITSPIIFTGETILELDGYVIAGASGFNMLQNKNTTTYDDNVIIKGGYWDGNWTANNIIYFEVNTAAPWYRRGNIFKDLVLKNAAQNGLYINRLGGDYSSWTINNVQSRSCIRNAFYLYGVNDFTMSDCYECAGDYNEAGPATYATLRIDWGSSGTVTNCYFNAWVYIYSGRELCFSNIFQDTTARYNALTLHGVGGCTFTNWRIRAVGSNAYNTKNGVWLESDGSWGHCTENTLSNFVIGRVVGASGTNLFARGINEANANQDYNLYSNICALDCSAGNAISGSNNEQVNILP